GRLRWGHCQQSARWRLSASARRQDKRESKWTSRTVSSGHRAAPPSFMRAPCISPDDSGMRVSIASRDAELGAITRFLDSLAAGSEILVLEGEPGIGKTTLWLAAVEQARERGFRVLSCRPSAAEARLSYASLGDMLADASRSVVDTLPEPQRRGGESRRPPSPAARAGAQ